MLKPFAFTKTIITFTTLLQIEKLHCDFCLLSLELIGIEPSKKREQTLVVSYQNIKWTLPISNQSKSTKRQKNNTPSVVFAVVTLHFFVYFLTKCQ